MEFMGKKLEDIIVTLPYEDGTSIECGVYSYFEVNNKKYFALLPLKGEKELDFSQSYMLYEVQEDEEDHHSTCACSNASHNTCYLCNG